MIRPAGWLYLAESLKVPAPNVAATGLTWWRPIPAGAAPPFIFVVTVRRLEAARPKNRPADAEWHWQWEARGHGEISGTPRKTSTSRRRRAPSYSWQDDNTKLPRGWSMRSKRCWQVGVVIVMFAYCKQPTRARGGPPEATTVLAAGD